MYPNRTKIGYRVICYLLCDTPQGKEMLHQTVDTLVDMLFDRIDGNKETYRIARNMKREGVDLAVVSRCTGLSVEEVGALSDY